MIDLHQVLTFSEAAEKWGLASGNTLRKAVERKKFKPEEVRKSGDVWLTTYPAMVRVYGKPRNCDITISITKIADIVTDAIYHHKDDKTEVNIIMDSITDAIENKKTVTVIESDNRPENILTVIKSKEDLENFSKTLQRYLQSFAITIKK